MMVSTSRVSGMIILDASVAHQSGRNMQASPFAHDGAKRQRHGGA